MSARSALVPYRDARNLVLSRLTPAAAEFVPLASAKGWMLAEDVVASQSLPHTALAGRQGIAVASRELVGASPYTPALLTSRPLPVLPGDPLPPAADAVLEAQAVLSARGVHEIGQSAYPGEGAVLPGADLAAGSTIASAGMVATPAMLLTLALGGTDTLAVRRPVIALIDRDGAAPEVADWLRATLAEAGCRCVGEGPGTLRLVLARDPLAAAADHGRVIVGGLALNPGRDIAIADDGDVLTLICPCRFDAAVAAFHALIGPAVAAMTGAAQRLVERPLTGKLVSQVGFAELALLRGRASGYEPLGVGHVSLSALIAADAAGIVAAESEGAPAGSVFAATPLENPNGSP